MRIISRSTIRDYWEQHPDAKGQLEAWFAMAKQADWKTPADVKASLGKASIIGNNRVVFNIHGNTYRLIVGMNYNLGICFIKFIGTHAEYDKVDAQTVERIRS